MTRIVALAFGLASAILAFPATSSEGTRPECEEARLLARTMFQSDAPTLYAPLHLPPDMRSELILGAMERDLSAGDALTATAAFAKLPSLEGGSVYWLREPGKDQKRIAVSEESFGWRGVTYSLFQLDRSLTPTAFMNERAADSVDAVNKPVIAGSWRPPLVFQLPDSPGQWVIDVGQPFDALASWTIQATDAADPICRITFGNKPGHPQRALPAEVRSLARQLDEALGPGSNEGTLQPTARLRAHAARVLANATYRPWALAESDTYNSRVEVDAGLKQWAKGVSLRQALRRKINDTYPAAQASLAYFYERTFRLSKLDANSASKWVLDIIFRSYFVFPRNGGGAHDNGGANNPWPREGGLPKGSSGGVHLQPGARVAKGGWRPVE